jgi:hypothetical protein
MAGDWIRIRRGLRQLPKTVAIARSLAADRDFMAWWAGPVELGCRESVTENVTRVTFENVTRVTACALTEIWFAINDVIGADCKIPYMELSDIDEIVGVPGFGKAMEEVGWVVVDELKGLFFPNFTEHNVPDKLRSHPKSAAERAREYRGRNCAEERVTKRHETSRGEEKRRGENIRRNKPAAQVPTSKPPPASSPAPKISWDETSGFTGISAKDRDEWARAYPAAELEREFAKAHAWLRANPKKAGKRNWRLFVVRWLARCQDNGGTNREIGRRPDEKPAAKGWSGADAEAFERTRRSLESRRREFRSDADTSMTDAEYAAWARSKHLPPSRNGHAAKSSS